MKVINILKLKKEGVQEQILEELMKNWFDSRFWMSDGDKLRSVRNKIWTNCWQLLYHSD